MHTQTPTRDTRDAAYRAVVERPGAAIADVAERLGVDHSTASYHLRRLERRGAVVARPAGRARAYYANGSGVCPYLQRELPRLRARAVAPTLRALLDAPEGVTVARLTREGLPAGAARWALRRLTAAGIAARTRHGVYALAPERAECARRALAASHSGSPEQPEGEAAGAAAACPRWGACAVSKRWARHGARRERRVVAARRRPRTK